jgi:hypothetical protein
MIRIELNDADAISIRDSLGFIDPELVELVRGEPGCNTIDVSALDELREKLELALRTPPQPARQGKTHPLDRVALDDLPRSLARFRMELLEFQGGTLTLDDLHAYERALVRLYRNTMWDGALSHA